MPIVSGVDVAKTKSPFRLSNLKDEIENVYNNVSIILRSMFLGIRSPISIYRRVLI